MQTDRNMPCLMCVCACICSAGPLVVAMVLTLAVVAKATLNFLEYTRVSEERFKALREDNAVYKTLAEQWAPLSMYAVNDDDQDGLADIDTAVASS